MSLFQSSYIGSSFTYSDADFGNFPNMLSLQIGTTLFNFPAGFNPTGLGSATPQDFADSVAAEINNFLTTKLGAGNFTPVTATHSTDTSTSTIQFSNFDVKDAILFQPNGSASIQGSVERGPSVLSLSFSLGFFNEMLPATNAAGESCLNNLLNCPKDYNHDIWDRGRNEASER